MNNVFNNAQDDKVTVAESVVINVKIKIRIERIWKDISILLEIQFTSLDKLGRQITVMMSCLIIF